MPSERDRQRVTCDDCGREVGRPGARGFVSGTATFCRQCAEARGGVYDFIHGVWCDAPDLSRPSTPPPPRQSARPLAKGSSPPGRKFAEG